MTSIAADGSWFGGVAVSAEATRTPAGELEGLMGRYADGDADAFDALYRRVAPRLFSLLLRMTRDRALAEDLLQTTFAKVHRARGAYLRGAPVMPWLVAIARRSVFDHDRRRKVRRERLSEDGSMPDSSVRSDGGRIEAADELDQLLQSLPPKLRDAVLLTKLEGLSVAEAAEVLGTTSAAVKLRVHRARKLLEPAADESASAAS